MSKADIEQLATWRTLGARHSEEVVELAPAVLRAGKLGDQEWAVREQLAIAALDTGNIELADAQIAKVRARFKGSPRLAIIMGMRCEAVGDTTSAKTIYEELLVRDETNVAALQRLIALSQTTAPATTIPALLQYLDTFYADAPAWSLLADLYAEQGLYAQSLTALGHVLLLQTWNSGAVCRAGETAYTIRDYQLALKHFLRAIEMETDPVDPKGVTGPTKTRSWWGVQKSVRRLLDGDDGPESSVPVEQRTTEKQLKALDQLATERLLAAGGEGKDARRRVLAGSTAAPR